MHRMQQQIDDLCEGIVFRAADGIGFVAGALRFAQDMQDDRHDILNIDRLKLNFATANQRHYRRGMNEIRETFDERSILAKQDGWLNDRPIESALLEYLLGKVASLHIA